MELDALSVRLGRAQVLDGVSARLAPGQTVALIGPNGAGKSTLLKALAGLLRASGKVRLEGRALPPGPRRAVAYMPQDTGAAAALSVLEVVLMGRLERLGLRVDPALRGEALEMLARFGLGALAHRPIGALSGGQRQLVFLAQTLFRAPKVMLLDEPTAALDLRHQLMVLERVRAEVAARAAIAVVAVHDLTLAARFVDRILCLSGGRIRADGAPAEVLDAALLRAVYGVVADIAPLPSGTLVVAPLRALGGTGANAAGAKPRILPPRSWQCCASG
ncbi:MAG: ABC transporter ATP-binding protein [Alphaproteobacteria bacterium]|nr:MAG: ABC transporter ATP-binding protein [Alphaproteobacteria bacterium]